MSCRWLRVVRILRIARILRIFRVFRELWILWCAVSNALNPNAMAGWKRRRNSKALTLNSGCFPLQSANSVCKLGFSGSARCLNRSELETLCVGLWYGIARFAGLWEVRHRKLFGHSPVGADCALHARVHVPDGAHSEEVPGLRVPGHAL